MAIVERIQSEHRDIRSRLLAFEKGVVGLTAGRLVGGLEFVGGLDTFIQASVLSHFALEEETVFPQLAAGPAPEKGLARELLAEHLALRDSFVNYVVEARKGKLTQEFLSLARGMSSRLLNHTQREDSELVPLLRRWMGLGGTWGTPAGAGRGDLLAQETDQLAEMVPTLARSRLFSRLTEVELLALARTGRWREFSEGEALGREGETASTLSVMERGTVAVVRTVQTKAGTMSFTAALATAGDVIGWSALVEPYHYRATAHCMVPVRCVEMDGTALRSLLAGSPATYAKVMENLVMMVRGRLDDTMEALGKNL
ncbi:MAG: hemerythrin domain-containing protein [Chloroflexi bacterium]|nr:hemerythrin domain-containing protein [Chloroflexota bacterium]